MNRISLVLPLGIAALAMTAPQAEAVQVDIHVGTAPNVYGSPAWAPWWDAAKQSVVDGTFVDMADSYDPANVGTDYYHVRDQVVYSFGDLGQRMHFIYWIPQTTIQDLIDAHFEVRLQYEWDGMAYDAYDTSGDGWTTPGNWEEYQGGVIGSGGWAFWGAYQQNTQEALDADLQEWPAHIGDVTFEVRSDSHTGKRVMHHRVPSNGSTLLLFAPVALGLVVWGSRRKTAVRA